MSDLSEVVELKRVLEETPYGELKAKFAELGVEEIFKGGVKKETLVQLALQKIEELRGQVETEIEEEEEVETEEEEVETEEVETEEIETEITKGITIDEEEEISLIVVEEEEEIEDEDQDEEEDEVEVVRTGFTREEIEENLEIVDANMRQATEFQLKILRSKKTELIQMLEDLNDGLGIPGDEVEEED